MRLLLALAMLCVALSPAEAARRPVRRRAPPPIIWLTAPQPPPIPILLIPPPAEPEPPVIVAVAPVALPDAVRALFAAAEKADDPVAFAAVAKLARATNPAGTGQIDALVAENDARVAEAKALAARERADRLARAAFLDNWKGEVEAGASRATGNSENLGLYGSLKLEREGLRWRHALTGRIDYQKTDGITTTERAVAAFQPNYKFDDRLFAYGLGQYEHDRFLGYSSRFTGGAGLGYTIVSNEAVKVEVTGGPAVRVTDFYDRGSTSTIAGRGSLAARWTLAPGVSLTQDGALFVESESSTATATTALDTRLIGALRARLSYNVTYERDAPAGRRSLDTLSRATLVYGF